MTKSNEINHCFFTGNKDVFHKRMAKQFSSCPIEQEDQLNNGDQIREDLAKIFEQHSPQSCFLALYNNKPAVPVELSVPKAPMEIAKELRLKKGASLENLMETMTLMKQDTGILCRKKQLARQRTQSGNSNRLVTALVAEANGYIPEVKLS